VTRFLAFFDHVNELVILLLLLLLLLLLPMQSVGVSTSLIQIVFGSLMSVSFLNKNNCSLSLYHLFVFNCFLLCFILFSISVLACN
jgi:hypothetical protein